MANVVASYGGIGGRVGRPMGGMDRERTDCEGKIGLPAVLVNDLTVAGAIGDNGPFGSIVRRIDR